MQVLSLSGCRKYPQSALPCHQGAQVGSVVSMHNLRMGTPTPLALASKPAFAFREFRPQGNTTLKMETFTTWGFCASTFYETLQALKLVLFSVGFGGAPLENWQQVGVGNKHQVFFCSGRKKFSHTSTQNFSLCIGKTLLLEDLKECTFSNINDAPLFNSLT